MEKEATRESFGRALEELGMENKKVVVLDADLYNSTKTEYFKEKYPNRFVNVGIAEADMIGTAAGLATCGKIPYASTFAAFATGRVYDQIRVSISYPKLNELATLTHSVANFMPCPSFPYNSAKGLVKKMHDFFPLFIDLIDAHCKQGKSITFYDHGEQAQVEVEVETLQRWREWFISNRGKYCLEDHYYIYTDENGEGRIKGIPFFKSQNLSHPLPCEENEIVECLDEMVKRIRVRAFRLLECQHRKET